MAARNAAPSAAIAALGDAAASTAPVRSEPATNPTLLTVVCAMFAEASSSGVRDTCGIIATSAGW